MSSPSMVAAVAREALIDKVVGDIRTLLRHGFIQPEDGGNCDEALFNCLLACQASSPWGISLSDLFDGQDASSPSISGRGTTGEEDEDEDGRSNDRRLVCHLLKLALRRRQLSNLLRNFCSSPDVMNLWYSENACVRQASFSGSLLLLVRAIETDRPGLLACMLTRPPFVEGMFSVKSDRSISVEQAVEVTPEMDFTENYDDYPPEPFFETGDNGLGYLSSSIKETMQSLLSFFTNQRSGSESQSISTEENDDNKSISFSPSSVRSAPVPTGASRNRRSRKDFHSVGEEPFGVDEDQLAYQTLSASDLRIARLCVQPELQPDHLFASPTKAAARVIDPDVSLASVSPLPASPVGQRLAEAVSNLTQDGSRRDRQRRSSIQVFLAEGDAFQQASQATASPGLEDGQSSPTEEMYPDETTIRLPALSDLRTITNDSDELAATLTQAAASTSGETEQDRAMVMSTSPQHRGPRSRAKKTSDAGIRTSGIGPGAYVPGHRRVFSDGLPAELLQRVHHSESTSSLPVAPARIAAPSTSTDDSDHVSNLTDAGSSTLESIEPPMLAIGPELDEEGDPEVCYVPAAVIKPLFSALKFNLQQEISRLTLLLDDLYSRGLNELEALPCTERLRQNLISREPSYECHTKPVTRWRNARDDNDTHVADAVISNSGEGVEARLDLPMVLKDPLCDEDATHEEVVDEGFAELNTVLPPHDILRRSPSLMRLLLIFIRSPDLLDERSPTHVIAMRLASLSGAVTARFEEFGSNRSPQSQPSRRGRKPDSAEYLGVLRRYAKGALSETDTFEPPELKVICEVYSKKYRADQLVAQCGRCAGCGQPSPSYLAKRFRFCEYFGRYYCELCHQGDSAMILPGRVLRQWNFSVYSVSIPAVEFLKRLFHRAVFRPPRSLVTRVKSLREFDVLRRQLALFMPFLETCRKAGGVRTALAESLPKHWLWPETCKTPLYSMQDFSRLRWGKAIDQVRSILRPCVEHISMCPLCQAKGFICELCSQGPPIFPFELTATFQCSACGACYHQTCWSKCPEGAASACCPRCSRIEERNRRRLIRSPSHDEAEYLDDDAADDSSPSGSVVLCSVSPIEGEA